MPKKKISQNLVEDMQENNEELSIPEENVVKNVEVESEVPVPKSKKYTNFVIRQKDQYAQEVRNIIRNELLNFEKEKQQLKLQRKQQEEELKREKENQELMDTVRKLRDFGLDPAQVIQETRINNQKNITQKKCIFCNNAFNKNNLTRHMNVCLHNPDSKSHQFLKSKKKLENEKKEKAKKIIEEPEEEIEEPEPPKPVRIKPTMSYTKRPQKNIEEADIW
jgi:hypothetical protein